MKSKINANGGLKTNSTPFKKVIFSLHTWYTNQTYGAVILIALLLFDFAGFYQLVSNTLYESPIMRVVIIGGFTAAFELAPLYIGYTQSLDFYEWGIKPFNKLICTYARIAFVLGVLTNIIYRCLTLKETSENLNLSHRGSFGFTIVMCILPVITSLINLVIGCLAFDPLYMHLTKLSKQIAVLTEKERQLIACLEEYDCDTNCESRHPDKEKADYECMMIYIDTMQTTLKNYIVALYTFEDKRDSA